MKDISIFKAYTHTVAISSLGQVPAIGHRVTGSGIMAREQSAIGVQVLEPPIFRPVPNHEPAIAISY